MRRARAATAAGALVALLGGAGVARADGAAVPLDLVAPGAIRIDGVPKEWPTAMTPLARRLRGGGEGSARGALAYDESSVYVAFDVTDAHLARSAACGDADDHAVLALAFPDASGALVAQEIAIAPGDPGKLAGCVKSRGAPVAGARVVEAPKGDGGGVTFEAQLPWSAFPEAARVRIGLRAVLRWHDGATVLATATDTRAAEWPPAPTEPEQAIEHGLVREKGISAAPTHDRLADVAGDGMLERVLVRDRWLLVVGPHFRGGREYWFADLGTDGSGPPPSLELRDLTGDGRADLVIRRRAGGDTTFREIFEVRSAAGDEGFSPVFRHEVGVASPAGRVTDDVRIASEGSRATIEVSAGAATGFGPGTYREPTETTMPPVLLPWGAVRARTFAWNGSTFALVREQAQDPAAPPPAAPTAAAPLPVAAAPRGPTGDELALQVYAQYRRDRKVGDDEPRFDLSADVAEDARAERVVVHGRELAIFGKGFRGGTSYTFATLPVDAGKDVLDLTARDLTGDGKAELVARIVTHLPAPPDLGGGTVDRELLLVYGVGPDGPARLFAAETARSLGQRRVQAAVRFVARGRASALEIAPGRATGFTQATWPFAGEPAQGGVEPLPLPWSGAKPARWRWNGSAFSR